VQGGLFVRNKSSFFLSLLATLFVLACSSFARGSCVTSASTGTCGPYSDSQITESTGDNTYVDQDVWGGVTWSQTLTATSPSSWYVSANIAASTSRVSFPYTYQLFNGEAVSSFTNIVAAFNETSDHSSSTEEQAGFDIYLNNWGNEIQIQHDMVNTAQCGGTTPVATGVNFGGSYGVPTESWDLCHNGVYYWQLPKGSSNTYGESSGSVDLIAMIKYLETNGYLPSSSTMTEVSYGFIIDTTSATTKTFTVNSLSITNNASGSPTISLFPTSLSFSATAGGANPASQNVGESNSGSGTLASPTTSITYHSGSGWLSVTASGSSGGPYTLLTQPTTGSLAAGTYTATVNVSSSGASNSPQSYPVTFTVNPVSSPAISLSPTSLTFNATVGGSNPSSQNVTVSNSGGGTLASPTTSTTYHSGSGWLSVNCTGSSAPYTCSTQPTTGSLAAGTYTATVNVSSSGASNSPQSYTVSFTLSSGSVCEITGADSICPSSGLYYDTSLSPTTWGQITQNDVWNPPSSWTQDMYTTNPGDWYIEANFPTDSSGAIKSYPSAAIQYYESGQTSDPNPTLDSFTEIVGAFSETAPAATTGTVSDIGYDMWFNDWASEIMIQHQNINTDVCTDWTTVIATDVKFGGTNGVPVEYWNLCQNGTFGSSNPELIWQYYATAGSKTFGESSGSVDIYAMLKYLEGNAICKTATGTTACLPASSTLTQFGYGFEISTTDGTTQQFTVNSLAQTAVQ
jgi:hypothetical protein